MNNGLTSVSIKMEYGLVYLKKSVSLILPQQNNSFHERCGGFVLECEDLGRMFDHSRENVRPFKGECSTIQGRLFDHSRENVRPFKGGCSTIQGRLFDHSRETVRPFKGDCSTIQGRMFDHSFPACDFFYSFIFRWRLGRAH